MAGCFLIAVMGGCEKTEYNVIPDAAYLRVFNSLNYTVNLSNKDQPQPFLTMVIDPEFDANGLIISGKVTGDFLDKRDAYAPPYPANAGTTSYKNTEYPGAAKIAVAPIVNGINLSSWAQVASGKHRVQFYSRPVNPTPFYSLEERDRKSLLIDSTIDFTPGEIYTMEVLQTKYTNTFPVPVGLYLRKESFTKQPFSDSMMYVNFYNLSSEGFAAAQPLDQYNDYNIPSNFTVGFGDTMNIYATLLKDDAAYPYVEKAIPGMDLIPGYTVNWLGTLVRSYASGVAPYHGFPMFAANDTTGGILSRVWETFTLLKPGVLSPIPGLPSVGNQLELCNTTYGVIGCTNIANDGKYVDASSGIYVPRPGIFYKMCSTYLPNLIRYTPSGPYPQRSFGTVSSIEIINNQVYMMSVQRTYDPPNN